MLKPNSGYISTLLIIFFLLPICSFSQSTYDRYTENTKILTQMEWRLLNVNLALATSESKVTFNSDLDKFECESWVITSDAKVSTETLRSSLLSIANLVTALLENYFDGFNSKTDLVINYRLGLQGYGNIAEFRNDKFRFTDTYYEYLREVNN